MPPALGVPQPGPANDGPYSPQPILQGGVVVPLYPADAPFLNKDRVREAEQYNMSKAVPERISSIVGIIYPGPTPFARGGNPPIPRNTPPAFISCAGSGDRGHAIWANEYFSAMLQA